MTSAEIIRLLRKKGWKLHKPSGKKHDLYEHELYVEGYAEVPRHHSKELKTGTMNDILSKIQLVEEREAQSKKEQSQ